MKNIQCIWSGTTSYAEGNQQQEIYFEKALAEDRAFLLGFEFQPVITLGKRGSASSDLLVSSHRLRSQGFDIHQVDRGGFATLHSAGQLVVYPVFPLKAWNLRLREFIYHLQVSTQNFLTTFAVNSLQKHSTPGLYTENGKIAFFGFRIRDGVSQHGLSINISNDLEQFKHIRSCGIQAESFDRLAHYIHEGDRIPSMEEMFFRWCSQFKEQWADAIQLENIPVVSNEQSQTAIRTL